MEQFKPSIPPQPIKKNKPKENIWMIIMAITFIAIIFMLYIFAWEEAKSMKQINHIKTQSTRALLDLSSDSQKTISFLQGKIKTLETNITGKKDPQELKNYINQIIILEGKLSKDITQHPLVFLPNKPDYKNNYVDTEYGQIQVLSEEKIACDDILILTGSIHDNSIKNDDAVGKNSYEGYYMTLQNYECLNTKSDFSCAADSDCILQKTSCDPCACEEVTNEENKIAIKCPAPNDEIICDAYCPYNVPKCIGGKCQLIRSK